MTESSEYTTATTPVVTEPVAERTVVSESKPNRLYQAAAWVAIVAGTMFIVAVVFFSGFILGKHSGGPGHFGRHGGPGMMMDRHGPPMGPMHRGGPGQGDGWPDGPGPSGPAQPPLSPPAR